MEFRILGPLDVVDGARRLEVRGPKVRALLAALVVHAGAVLSKDRLLEILWGPEPPEGAPATLLSHLSHLRNALEPGRAPRAPSRLVVTRDPGYALLAAPEQVDAVRFERLAKEGRQIFDAGRPDAGAELLGEALALWRGDPLAEFTFEPFAQAEIARLTELRLRIVEDRFDADLALGRHHEAVGRLETLVGEHPLRERIWGQLMLALYRCGRQAEALRSFGRLRQVLAEQLGIDPSHDLVRLEEAILLQKPELDWARPPAPPARARLWGWSDPAAQASRDEVASPDPLAAGLEAFTRRVWPQAFELLRSADQTAGLTPELLEYLAEAAFWAGRPHDCIEACKRMHNAYLEAGNGRRAAFAALLVSLQHAARLRLSVAAGWFGMAHQLLDGEPDCVEKGYLAWTTTTVLIVMSRGGDAASALEAAQKTHAAAISFGDPDLEAVGLTYQGYVLVRQGELVEGRNRLDHAMAKAAAGQLRPLAAATVICRTLSTCVDLCDYRRATEWLDTIEDLALPAGLAGFPGDCRIHHAQVLLSRGAWSQAEMDARCACSEMDDFVREHAGLAFACLGEINRRRGNVEGAAEAFERANDLGNSAQPGMALLLLERGDAWAATSSIRHALAEEPWDLLTRARLLPAQVEIAVAARDWDSARAAASELSAIAAHFGTSGLLAAAEQAEGAVLVAEDAPGPAVAMLRRSCQRWTEIGATYDAARARCRLGAALCADGNPAAAALEFHAARRTFQLLGAGPDTQKAADGASSASINGGSGSRPG